MKHTDETKKKISLLRIGRKHTEETKIKISESRKGKCMGDSNPSKRQEVIQKIIEKMKGRKITWADKISATRIKKFKDKELIHPNLGKPMSAGQKLKISKTRIEKGLAKLDKNPMWQGGISFEHYTLEWTKELRESIRKKYKNKCFRCNKPELSKDKRTMKIRKIPIHHINYIKKDIRINNLIPLCTKCHAQVNKERDYWHTFFCHKLEISPIS